MKKDPVRTTSSFHRKRESSLRRVCADIINSLSASPAVGLFCSHSLALDSRLRGNDGGVHITAVAGLVIFLLCGFTSTSALASSFSDHARISNPPQRMPPLVFDDANGVQHSLADYRGSYVLLNVWATWCGPCVREMPSLDALQKKFEAGKLVILPLSEDRNAASLSAFYRLHALVHLPVAVDSAGIAPSALHLRGLPTSLLVDPHGQEIARFEGDADWNSPEALEFLRQQAYLAY
jgi:thiol-disulfide isomerase/thioredoxin